MAVCKGAPALCRMVSSGKVLTWMLCLVLGAVLRDACSLGRGNLKPLMRMIRALNSIYLNEGHNEVASFISEKEEGADGIPVFIYVRTSGQVQQGRFKFDIKKKSLMASVWKFRRNCLHHQKSCNWIR